MVKLTESQAVVIVDLYRLGEITNEDGWISRKAALLVVSHHLPRSKHQEALQTIIKAAGDIFQTNEDRIIVLRLPKKSEVSGRFGVSCPISQTALENLATSAGLSLSSDANDEKKQTENRRRRGRHLQTQPTPMELVILSAFKKQEEQEGSFSRQDAKQIVADIAPKKQVNALLMKYKRLGWIEQKEHGFWRLTKLGTKFAAGLK